MDKIIKNNKNSRKTYDNYYSDELREIFTAESVLSDVYLGKQHLSFAYKTTRRRNLDRSSDNYLMYCTSCNMVWENHMNKVYHDNLPSYGKTRKKCERCKRREQNGQS